MAPPPAPNADAPADRELLLAWSRGDRAAGEQLFERHFEVLYRLIATLAPGSTEVADLVQRTFLACVERIDEISDVERFRPYLLGIARNQVRMHHRYQRVRAGEEPVEDAQEYARTSWSPRLSAIAAQREQQRLLLLALRKLPLEQQMPLELHYWDGLSTREIGELLDLKPTTVKKRLFTARQRLAQLIRGLAVNQVSAELSIKQFDGWAQQMRELVEPKGADPDAEPT